MSNSSLFFWRGIYGSEEKKTETTIDFFDYDWFSFDIIGGSIFIFG